MANAREPVRLIRSGASLLPLLPVLGFILAFALVPALLLFVDGWIRSGGAAGFASAITDPLTGSAFTNSFVQGTASAAAAVALGFPAGVFLGRYRGRGRPMLLALFLIPFLLPVLVMVQGVEVLFGPLGYITGVFPAASALGEGLPGVIVVNVLFNVPLVVLFTAVGTESGSAALESTVATLSGGSWRRFRDVWGIGALLGAAAGALVTFLFSALAFASPLLVCGARCYTVEVRVWALDQQLAQPATAAMVGLALVLAFALPALLYLWAQGRLRATATGGTAGNPQTYASKWPARALAAWTFLLLVAELSVAAAVLLGSVFPPGEAGFSAASWQALFSPHVEGQLGIPIGAAFANSLFFAAACAAIALALGIVSGYWVRRASGTSISLRWVLLFPLLLSPVLLAFALANAWGSLLAGPASVWLLIILSQTVIALPFVIPTLLLSLRSLSRAPRETAEVLGTPRFLAYLEMDLPRARAGVWTAAVLAFVIGLGEFTATLFLATPPFATLPVVYYDLNTLREPAAASACAALLLIVSALSLLALSSGGRRVAF